LGNIDGIRFYGDKQDVGGVRENTPMIKWERSEVLKEVRTRKICSIDMTVVRGT